MKTWVSFFLLTFSFCWVSALSALAGSLVPEGTCEIVVASRSNVSEARSFIQENNFADRARVFQSSNGWLAISIGRVPATSSKAVLSTLKARGQVPDDSYCSTGDQYVRVVRWAVAGEGGSAAENKPGTSAQTTSRPNFAEALEARSGTKSRRELETLLAQARNELRKQDHALAAAQRREQQLTIDLNAALARAASLEQRLRIATQEGRRQENTNEVNSQSSLPTLAPENEESSTTASSFCATVNFLTIANGGYSTFHTQDDPEFILAEQFCMVRVHAMARGKSLVSAPNDQFPPSAVETCKQFADVVNRYTSGNPAMKPDEVLAKMKALLASNESNREKLANTGTACLGVGYQENDVKTTLASATMLFALGGVRYSEILGHHYLHGIGLPQNTDAAKEWYGFALADGSLGDRYSFEPSSEQRDQLMREAIGRLN